VEEREGKKMGEPGKNSGETKPQKMLAKLPSNYSELPPEEQAKWRGELAKTILERIRKP
jgi:hypothetical protein